MSSINFLNKTQATENFNKEKYFSTFNIDEIIVRIPSDLLDLCVNNVKLYYIMNIQEFTDREKHVLNKMITMSLSMIYKTIAVLYPNVPINVIKLNSNVDWNYPFTVNNSIVLTQSVIDGYLRTFEKFEKEFGIKSASVWNLSRLDIKPLLNDTETICHEIFHIVQRNPTLIQSNYFNKLYKQWGYVRVNPKQFTIQKNAINNMIPISNPDGYNFNFIMPLLYEGKWKWFTPLLIYDQSLSKPVNVIAEINTYKNTYEITNNIINVNDYSLFKYTKLPTFPQLEKLNHPNETFAYVYAKWLINY